MRIVIWTDSYRPEIGGLEVFCLRLTAGLRARGDTCMVVTNGDVDLAPRHEWIEGVEVQRYAFQQNLNRANLAGFLAVAEECRAAIAAFAPDVIHLNVCSKGLMAFALLQRHHRWPAVMTLHDRHIYRHRHPLSAEVFAYSDAVVGVSEFIRRDTLAHFPELAPKLSTILNSLPEPTARPAPLPAAMRFLAAGRLIRDKGFDLAIEGFARIAVDFPEATLTIAGGGDERPKLEQLAAARSVEKRVAFLGWQEPDEMNDLINRYSVVIMPSRWEEPFGLVALQAAQMGRAICASKAGGLPEIVIEGETGMLFEIEDVEGLAGALRTFLEAPERAAEMGRRAYERAGCHFRYAVFLDRYQDLFRRVAEPERTAAGF